MMRRVLFQFHITANSRPSMFSLRTASRDRTHSARAEGKPQILPDNGGQIRSDSQTATHKCMKCFDLQTDCQNFSFLIPICSGNIFLFVIFFLKSSVVPWNNCSSNCCQYFYFTSSNSSKIIVFGCALVSIKLTFVKQFLAFFSWFHWVWWCVGVIGALSNTRNSFQWLYIQMQGFQWRDFFTSELLEYAFSSYFLILFFKDHCIAQWAGCMLFVVFLGVVAFHLCVGDTASWSMGDRVGAGGGFSMVHSYWDRVHYPTSF